VDRRALILKVLNREKDMKRSQGFTLIELIAVIAILAILAATAIPQFVDLRAQARVAALNGVAGSVASASALNYATRVATNSTSGVAVATCGALSGLVQGVTITATITPPAGQYGLNTAALTNGTGGPCILYNDAGDNVQFTAIGSN
jgi:prepilin-type N-terminal cleavage/methylation domain-containing protein